MKMSRFLILAVISLLFLLSCEETGISVESRDISLVDSWTYTSGEKITVIIEKEFFADGTGIQTTSGSEILSSSDSFVWFSEGGVLYFRLDGSVQEIIPYTVADGILTETYADGTVVQYICSALVEDDKIPIDEIGIKEK